MLLKKHKEGAGGKEKKEDKLRDSEAKNNLRGGGLKHLHECVCVTDIACVLTHLRASVCNKDIQRRDPNLSCFFSSPDVNSMIAEEVHTHTQKHRSTTCLKG